MLLKYIFSFLFVFNSNASEVFFNGLSHLGNFNQKDRYLVSANFSSDELLSFNKSLFQQIQNNSANFNHLTIKTQIGKIKDGNAKLLSFGVTGEQVERFKENDGYFSFYKVYAQILVFDLVEKKVIVNYPVLSQHQEFTKEIPDSEFDVANFKKIYFDKTLESSIINEWVKSLSRVKIKSPGSLHLQLRNVTLADEVNNQLPDYLIKNDNFKFFTAQKFEYQLSTNQNVPLLPFTIGQMGSKSKLRARFSDAETYELIIPEADYVIDLLIRQFKNAKVNSDNYDGYIFGSFITLNVEEPLTKKVVLSSKFNNKNSLKFNKYDNVEITDPWVFYLRAQDGLFSKLTKQISQREKESLSKLTKTKNIHNQLKQLEGIIQKCR